MSSTFRPLVEAHISSTDASFYVLVDNYDGTNAAPEGGYQTVTLALQKQAEKDGAKFLVSLVFLPFSSSPLRSG